MMKKGTLLYLIFVLANIEIFPCTNLLITKGASIDGSCMITYSADSYDFYGELYHFPAAKYSEGAMLDIYDWNTGKYLGKIKQARETYNVVGNMNEYQVVIGETTFGGREELENPEGIIDYGSLMYITLQRSKTAREAIKIMTDLVEEYGYYSSGESFSIGDKNEVWILEMVGKGPGSKGAVWAAVKIPDGYISGHANQARITKFQLDDPENCIFSPDVISFAREKGYFNGKDSEFDFSAAYNPLDFGGVRFCDARVWSAFRKVNPEMDKYISYIRGESTERLPLYIKPDKKLSVKDVMNLMRDHYEGTELDMTQGVAAGPYNMPYRWRPLTWKHNDEEYFHERPVSTPQTGFSFVSQSRSFMPDEVGGVLWFGVDDTYMTVYTPLYSSITEMPYNFAQGRASLSEFSWDSAFWVFNVVSNFVYPRYSIAVEDVIKIQNELEGQFFANQKSIEDKALSLLKSSERDAVEFLNNYSLEMADLTIKRWKKLGEFLLVKYMDGISKDEYYKPKNIGYPEGFKELIVKEDGDKLRMKKLPAEFEKEFGSYLKKAESLLEEKNYMQAKEYFEKALLIEPENEEINNKISRLDEMIKRINEMHENVF